MRYILKQKLFSLGGAFHIKDDQGQDVFLVEGKIFSFGHQLSFRDMDGNVVVIDMVRADRKN